MQEPLWRISLANKAIGVHVQRILLQFRSRTEHNYAGMIVESMQRKQQSNRGATRQLPIKQHQVRPELLHLSRKAANIGAFAYLDLPWFLCK
jgi:hypothetical protein